MRFPDSVDGLLAALEATFPEVVPDPGDNHETTMFHAGQRSVVHYLKQWRAKPHGPAPAPRGRAQGRRVVP